jgi:CRP-like cAMP-binding protein
VDDIISLLPTQSTQRVIKKRTILIYQGEVPRQAYIVKSGAFKAYHLNKMGEEQIVGFRTSGDVFPETWVFGKTSSALYYYEALEDSVVYSVEKNTLTDLIDSHPELQRHMLDYFVSAYTSLLMQVNALEQSRAAEKLLLMLYYLRFRYGKEVKPGEFHLSIALTHTTLAGLLGLTRETTTIELGRLKRKEIINYNGREFVIFQRTLEDKLAREGFDDIQLK